MASEQLWRFLMEVQGGSDTTIAEAKKIVEDLVKQRHHIAKFTRNSLTLDDFFYYLFSVELNPPYKTQVNLIILLVSRSTFTQILKFDHGLYWRQLV